MRRKLSGIINVVFDATGRRLIIYSAFAKYLLTPWCRVLLEKLTGLQRVKKFPASHGTRRFITALTSISHLSLSWASPIQSIYPHPTSWRSVLILSIHLNLGLPSGLFPSGFPYQDLIHPPLLTHTCHMPSPSHSSRFYHPHILGEEYKSFSSSLCNPPFPRYLVPPSFLSSRNVSNQVSHPYKTKGKIIVLYIFIFKFLDSNLEDKRLCTE